MKGSGIIKGLGVTFKHFFDTYLVDAREGKKRYNNEKGIESRTSADVSGFFTVQYPEEQMPVPEEFRFLPFLVYEHDEAGEKMYRCTACGICSKVCPPQCIWITRKTDPVTGKPIPQPESYQIDTDICMNCGLCVEYCPFDAIKMDHDFELSSYDRQNGAHIYDKEKLGKPVEYYAKIRPVNFAREEAAKKAKAGAANPV
jgi:NADH-quinone oxidoreductase subunit I